MGVLESKRVLVTGVLTEESLAFGIARLAQEEGAEVVLTGAGRGLSITRRTARKLPVEVEVLELDVTVAEQGHAVAATIAKSWPQLDGLVHAIGYAPPPCLGSGILSASWSDVATAVEVSTYSLKYLAEAFLPLLARSPSAAIVGLDFDASVTWPGYDWMGVAKAGLESLARYLARDLGPQAIRVNLVAAGPIRTLAAKSIPGFAGFEEVWDARAPLGWDILDSTAVARATIALLSEWFPATTGEIIHVDGGYHAVGA
jgi:enoyl ACP reductase